MRCIAYSLLLSSLAGTSFGATFTVSNNNDSGPGSFRQAILDANSLPGEDLIQFAVTGTIPVTSGQLTITDDVIVDGPGASQLTLDAQSRSRVLSVSAGRTRLSGVTIRNGRAGPIQFGGGISVNGELMLVRCALADNEVPVNPGFGADGGGVFVNSGRRMSADQCLFLNNKVGLGTGGGVRGGSASVISLRNCTFSGNSATQGGALSCAGSATLDFCTIADNRADSGGGGAWAAVLPFTVSNSIVARNSAPIGPDWFGGAASSGFNLIGNPATSSGWVSSDLLNVDPLLGPFGDYGGETKLYSLLDGSPALDSANPLGFLSTDQRGHSRPQAAGPDRGAFEAEPFNEPPVADAGPDQTLECSGALTSVGLDGSGSSDPDGDTLQFKWYESGSQLATGPTPTVLLAKGSHLLTLIVTDPSGESNSDQVVVQIVDTTPPSIDGEGASPGALWPPNHKLWTVQVSYSVADVCDPNPSAWLTVSSSDPDSGMSSEDVPGDIAVLDGHTVKLRAERFERERVYTITIHARDADGNEASRTVVVKVPKSVG